MRSTTIEAIHKKCLENIIMFHLSVSWESKTDFGNNEKCNDIIVSVPNKLLKGNQSKNKYTICMKLKSL